MVRCENCKNALIYRSRTIRQISDSERLVSDWNIIGIKCKWNHETSIYREIDCQDWERESVRSVEKMTENKLEETIDLLAKYGGFNREYLRDKLLTFANDGRSETKNKIGQAATMNSFDKLLGRNGELVELRKEQVLAGAMRIIQQHYADKQNKMEAVAQLFSKKLFDKFHVKLGYDTFSARFSPYGFEIFGEHCMWITDGQILNKLLTGKAVILD